MVYSIITLVDYIIKEILVLFNIIIIYNILPNVKYCRIIVVRKTMVKIH